MKTRSHVVNLIKEFARKNYGVGKSIFGINLPAPYEQIERLILNNIAETPATILLANELPRERFEKFDLVNPNAGNLLKFNFDLASKKTADIDETRQAEVIISPGLGGGDSDFRLFATFNEFRKIFPQKNCLIYSPLDEGKDRMIRYTRGNLYYADQNSINEEESANFFEKVIKPKIIDDSGQLIPPQHCSKFILANFSIGCREAESHFKYLENYLCRKNCDQSLIEEYLNRMAIINIASPRNWELEISRPNTLSIVSLTDAGSKKPLQFLLDFYLNEEMHLRPISKIIRPNAAKIKKEMLVVMGQGLVLNGTVQNTSGSFRGNPLGHNLSNHIEGIKNNAELTKLVSFFSAFLDKTISDQEFENIKNDLFRDAGNYRKKLDNPSQKEMKALFESWYSYQKQEEASRNKVLSVVSAALFGKAEAESFCSESSLDLPKNTLAPEEAFKLLSGNTKNSSNQL